GGSGGPSRRHTGDDPGARRPLRAVLDALRSVAACLVRRGIEWLLTGRLGGVGRICVVCVCNPPTGPRGGLRSCSPIPDEESPRPVQGSGPVMRTPHLTCCTKRIS